VNYKLTEFRVKVLTSISHTDALGSGICDGVHKFEPLTSSANVCWKICCRTGHLGSNRSDERDYREKIGKQ
jgi:hypothetical protein